MTESVGWTHTEWLHLILYAFLLGAPSVAVAFSNDVGATILAAVGATSIILTRLPDVVSFSGFGMSARLDRKIKEADTVIAQLRSMSLAFARANLDEMASSGQLFAGFDTSRKFSTRASIIKSLAELGATQDDIQEAQDGWIEFQCYQLLDVIVERATEAHPDGQEAIRSQIEALPKAARFRIPTPDALRDWAADTGDKQLITMAEDYRRLLETGNMQNPNVIPFQRIVSSPWVGQPTTFSIRRSDG